MPINDPLSQVAHKLRTPLTVIMSSVGNFLDGAFGPVTEKQAQWLKKLEGHTLQLEKIVTEMVEVVRQQTSKEDLPTVKAGAEKAAASNVPIMESNAHPAVPFAAGESANILVVDDDADVLDVIDEGLKMKGYQTQLAETGKEALESARKNVPDLILMDLHLKHQKGTDLCQELKAGLDNFTPVILITGQNDLRGQISYDDDGPDDLLIKPFQIEELHYRVKSMLKIKALMDQVQNLIGSGRRAA